MFFRRWDSTVQGKTLRESAAQFTNMPFDQGITVPEPGKNYTQVLSLTINPWWSAHPYKMAQATFAGTVSKQVAAGVKREKIAMCDNFYTPKARPEIDYHLTEMVRAITDMMLDLGTPMISGKDSSSGTTKMTRKSDGHVENFEISPTICMSAMGMGEDAMKVPPKALQKTGNKLFFVSAGISNDASGSVLLPPQERQKSFNYDIDIQEYTKTIDRLAQLIDQGKVQSISVVDDGGIFHRVFEMMLGSGLGVEMKLEKEHVLEFLTKVVSGSFVIEAEDASDLEGLDPILLGEVTEAPELCIDSEVLTLDEMRSVWERTWYDLLKLPYEQKHIEALKNPLPYTPSKVTKKKVNIVYSPGINCHQEMVRAWQMLGTDVSLISVTDRHAKFADADIVIFPGGFADGDYLGAAKVWHRTMETQFKDQMDYLRTGKIPVLGICNGFQLMTRSGFFGNNLSLTFNDNAQFEQRWVKLKFTGESANSIWTKGLEGKEIVVPIAHGEGRFVVDGKMSTATVSLQYHPNAYPNNPNGSVMGIAGVFAGDKGQFWGGMPHPERAIEGYHYTQHGLLFFENILKNI
jgi:phosphoribosylformylglycinamidine synthase